MFLLAIQARAQPLSERGIQTEMSTSRPLLCENATAAGAVERAFAGQEVRDGIETVAEMKVPSTSHGVVRRAVRLPGTFVRKYSRGAGRWDPRRWSPTLPMSWRAGL